MASNLYATKRFTSAAVPGPPVQPADITDVQPGLRFLLTDEARAEGEAFAAHLKRISWSYQPERKPAWAESYLVAKVLPERYPHFHRANQVLVGLIGDALRNIAVHPGMPRTWPRIAECVAEGRPNLLRAICERVRDWKPQRDQAEDEGERSDSVWAVANAEISRPRHSRAWNDRDVSDDTADETIERRSLDLDLPQPTGDFADEIPF